MEIGKKIKEIRKEKGMTQKKLGELLNVSQQMVGQFEKSDNLRMDTIKKIAKALEVSPFELFDNVDITTEFSDENYRNIIKEIIDDDWNIRRKKAIIENFDNCDDTGKSKIYEYSKDIAEIYKK